MKLQGLLPACCIALLLLQAGARAEEPAPATAPQAAPAPSPTEPEAEAAPGAAEASPAPDSLLATLQLPNDFQQTAALWSLLARSDQAAVERLIEEAWTVADENDRSVALQVCYLRYADLDPVRAMDHLFAAKREPSQHTVYMLFNSWAKFEPDDAVRYAARIRSPQQRQMAARGILHANQDQDIDTLRRLATQLGPAAQSELANIEQRQLVEMVLSDPETVLDALQKSPMQQRYTLAHHIGAQLAKQDMQEALAFCDKVRPADMQDYVRMATFNAFAQTDPAGILADLDELPLDRMRRRELLNASVQVLAMTDPAAAVKALGKLEEPGEREQALGSLLMNLTHSNSAAAFDLVEAIDDPQLLRDHAQYGLVMLGQQDPERAMAFARSHADTTPELMSSVISGVAQTDPLLALQLAEEMPDSTRKASLVADALGIYALTEPDSASRLAETLPAGPQRQMVIRQVAESRFNSDPAAAMDWLFGLPARDQGAALQGLGYQLAQRDLPLARSLVDRLPSRQVQSEWINTILYTSADLESPTTTADWLENFADLEGYDGWMSTLVNTSANRGEAREALLVLDRIGDPMTYEQAAQQLVSSWAINDPKAAAAFVLDDDTRLENRAMAINSVAGGWARRDFRAAQGWVLGIDDSAERDQGLAALLTPELVSDQEAAVLYRRIIGDEVRRAALNSYALSLARYDSDAAIRFVRARNLLVEEEQALVEALEAGAPGTQTPD